MSQQRTTFDRFACHQEEDGIENEDPSPDTPKRLFIGGVPKNVTEEMIVARFRAVPAFRFADRTHLWYYCVKVSWPCSERTGTLLGGGRSPALADPFVQPCNGCTGTQLFKLHIQLEPRPDLTQSSVENVHHKINEYGRFYYTWLSGARSVGNSISGALSADACKGFVGL